MTSTQSTSSTVQTQVNTHIQFSIWQAFKRHIPRVLATTLVDIIFPFIIYFILQKYVKPVYAMIVAGTPPLFMVLLKAILTRTFDALGFLVAIGFIISEKSLVTGIVSIVFAISLIPFNCCCHHHYHLRPLAYYFYQDLIPTNREQVGLPANLFINNQESTRTGEEEDRESEVLIRKISDGEEIGQLYEWMYTNCPSFRFSCYLITSTWGVGFLAEFLARLTLILVHLSVNKIVIKTYFEIKILETGLECYRYMNYFILQINSQNNCCRYYSSARYIFYSTKTHETCLCTISCSFYYFCYYRKICYYCLRPVGYYMYQDLVPTNREDVGLPEHIFCDQQEQVDSRYTDLQEEVSSRKVFHKEEVVQVYDWIYKNCSSFRLSCIIITSIWAIGLLFEFLARLFLIIFHLPVNKIVIYGHVILSSITVICIVSTITCIAIERKHTLLFIETKQLITQQSFGSVFHQPSDSTTDETDDDDDENPLSDKCSDSGEAKNILHDTKCGLFINERYMNIPAEISLPAIRTLRLEMSFELDYWIVHAKLRLHTSDTSTIYYVNGEEEIFQQYPSLSIDYNPTQSNNNNNNNGWTHRRKIIFVSTYKLDEICSNIEQKLKK
ncbi:unnamed protein product [Rotaria socialis]